MKRYKPKIRTRVVGRKLAGYGVGVSSDILAEFGAGAAKLIKFIPSKVGLVATNVVAVLAVSRYWVLALILIAIITLAAGIAFAMRKAKRRKVGGTKVTRPRKGAKRRLVMTGGMVAARRGG